MIVPIERPVKAVTEKAIGIEDANGRVCWFAKSQIESIIVEGGEDDGETDAAPDTIVQGDRVIEIEIPDWLADRIGFKDASS